MFVWLEWWGCQWPKLRNPMRLRCIPGGTHAAAWTFPGFAVLTSSWRKSERNLGRSGGNPGLSGMFWMLHSFQIYALAVAGAQQRVVPVSAPVLPRAPFLVGVCSSGARTPRALRAGVGWCSCSYGLPLPSPAIAPPPTCSVPE
ncbi:hypothetical protein MIC448_410005 [Microbacterium sp. C448]|nr:hypothetical protein MIC448_410005 [Microbacterium sp. C448]